MPHALHLIRRKERLLFGLSGFLVLAHLVIVGIFVLQRYETLDFLRLHYTVELGVDWIDVWWRIFLFPGLGVFMLLINGMLAILLGRRNKTYVAMLGVATVMLEVALGAAGIFALLLNV